MLPAFAVLLGVRVLRVVGPADQVEAELDDTESRPFSAFRGEGELDEHRVAGLGCLARRLCPSERESRRRLDCLDDERMRASRRTVVVLERERAVAPRCEIELDAV